MSYNSKFVKCMEKYFYSSSISPAFRYKDIELGAVVRFAFYDSDIPHFSKIGEGVIKYILSNSVDIIIKKNQKFFDASAYGEGINLKNGLFIKSKYEDKDIAIFNLPIDYIWGIKYE